MQRTWDKCDTMGGKVNIVQFWQEEGETKEGLTHHHSFESRKNGAVTIGNKLKRHSEEEGGQVG